MTKLIDLSTLHEQPEEVQKAIAVYASYGLLPMNVSEKERERCYSILEESGYIERIESRRVG